ncbi:hypothetical protein [Rhizobium sp. RCC_161_2]|uniref:dual OB domain-containing protein n=1 Tax=Rhizobium sp. RCC_161_2 TaxID=3239219 RepID=UPI003523388E
MTAYSKTILCLANSRKTSGRCIAGRELINGQLGAWIRPVSSRENAELSEEDRRFENGQDARVLDIIRIPMLEPRPNAFQVENHLIDADYYWTLDGTMTSAQAKAAVDGAGTPLWSNQSSSYNGLHDRVQTEATLPADGSLRLIEVTDLEINVVVEGAEFGNGKRKVRGRFTHGATQHYLSITDPLAERQYLPAGNGVFPVGQALLCISLSEPYQGYAYKLIAAVIT